MNQSRLPESWAVSTLVEVVESIQYGATASSSSSGELILLRITDITPEGVDWNSVPNCKIAKKEGAKYLLENGDIVIARTGGTVGKSFRVIEPPANAIFASYLIRLRPKPHFRASRYLELFLQTPQYWACISEGARGAAQPNVNSKTLGNIGVPIPPKQEQERIVAKIESCLSRIDAIEDSVTKAEELLERYRASLLAKAFRGELVAQDSGDEPGSGLLERIRSERAKAVSGKRAKKDELSPITADEIPFEIPKSWAWVRLGELCYKIVDGTHHTPKYVTAGIPFISAKDVFDSSISFENTKFISEAEHRELVKRCKPEMGDILVTKSGTIGRTAVVRTDVEFSLFESVALLKVVKGLSPQFLELTVHQYVNSAAGLNRVKGAAIKHLHLEELREALVPLPPLPEQERITQRLNSQLSSLTALVEKFSKSRSLLIKQKDSILESAFFGGLVRQEISEGSGHDLLAQLKSAQPDPQKQVKKKGKSKS